MKALPLRWIVWPAFRTVLIACLVVPGLSSSGQAPPNPVPGNAADNYLAAAAKFKKNEKGAEDAGAVAQKGWVGKHPEFEKYLHENAAALAELREGFKKPYCSMPTVENYYTKMSYILPFRDMARLLMAEGRMLEAKGQYEAAYQNFTGGAKFGYGIARNGAFIHYLVSTGVVDIALIAIRRSLANPGASADTYAKVARWLEELERTQVSLAEMYRQEMALNERGLRCVAADAFEHNVDTLMAGTLCCPPKSFAWGPAMGLMLLCARSARAGPYPFEKETLWLIWPSNLQTAIDNMKRFCEEAILRAGKPYSEVVKTSLTVPNDPLSKMLLTSSADWPRPSLYRHFVWAAGTRAMLALVAYKKVHGRYPKALDEVLSAGGPPRTDAPLSRTPMDAFSGKPLRYKPVGDGFLLYSVGPDMVDDHAERECPDRIEAETKGDIVFRMER